MKKEISENKEVAIGEIKPNPSVSELAGFFKQVASVDTPDLNKVREMIVKERLKELGYDKEI